MLGLSVDVLVTAMEAYHRDPKNFLKYLEGMPKVHLETLGCLSIAALWGAAIMNQKGDL